MPAETLQEFKEEQNKPKELEENPTPEGNQEVTPTGPMVEIDGKKRPLENVLGEHRRKDQERIRQLEESIEEIKTQYSQPKEQQPNPNDFYATVEAQANSELATTGGTLPVRTILNLANSLYQKNYGHTANTLYQAQQMKEDKLDELEDKPGYTKEMGRKVKRLFRNIRPEKTSPQALDLAVNSVIGSGIDIAAIEKAAYEKAKKELQDDVAIVGPTSKGGSGLKPSKELTPDQQVELDGMNMDAESEDEALTPEYYLKILKGKQERFKNAGAKNVPQLHKETMLK